VTLIFAGCGALGYRPPAPETIIPLQKKPMGVQLVAGRFREDILLSAGADIETAGPKIEIANPV
jgi:Asp-tRNA(Asn)/Glu-tRNA(Gln) amidotransferase A subunit family amidase